MNINVILIERCNYIGQNFSGEAIPFITPAVVFVILHPLTLQDSFNRLGAIGQYKRLVSNNHFARIARLILPLARSCSRGRFADFVHPGRAAILQLSEQINAIALLVESE